MTTSPADLDIVVTLPDRLGEVLVRFKNDGTPIADYRESRHHVWTPVDLIGGSVEVRS